MDKISVEGGCHCGKIRYSARISRCPEVLICNCSICSKSGFQHLIVPGDDFELLAGKELLTEYRFNSKTARHFFCPECGVKSFYVPRSNPDGFSLNVRCLELPPECEIKFSEFDGRNWSKHAGELAHLSKK